MEPTDDLLYDAHRLVQLAENRRYSKRTRELMRRVARGARAVVLKDIGKEGNDDDPR